MTLKDVSPNVQILNQFAILEPNCFRAVGPILVLVPWEWSVLSLGFLSDINELRHSI